MKKRSVRASNFLASVICFALAALLIAPIWILDLKGIVLIVLLFSGGLFALLGLQLLVSAVFKGRHRPGDIVENTIADAIFTAFR